MKKYFIKLICFLEIILVVFGSVILILFLYNNLICNQSDCQKIISTSHLILGIKYTIGIFGFLFSAKFLINNFKRVKAEVASLFLICISIFLNYFLISTDINIYESIDGGFSVASIFLFFAVALIILSEKSLWEDLTSFGRFKITMIMIHILSFNTSLELGIGLLTPVIISDIVLSNQNNQN